MRFPVSNKSMCWEEELFALSVVTAVKRRAMPAFPSLVARIDPPKSDVYMSEI